MVPWHSVRRVIAICLALAASLAVATEPAGADRVDAARAALGQLRDAESAALLDLFAAEAALARSRGRVADLEERTSHQADRVADARREVRVGSDNLRVARRALSTRLAAAFRAGDVDAVMIVLGAESIVEALDGLAVVQRVSAHDAELVSAVSRGLRTSRTAVRTLAAEQGRLRSALAAAAAEDDRLAAARSAKAGVVLALRDEQHLTRRRITLLTEAAAAANERAQQIAEQPDGPSPAPAPDPAPSPTPDPEPDPDPIPPTGSGRTLTVSSTAYALRGTTATGIQTRRGVCATDPRVIPLGTRFDVPGYGSCVAADTGSAIIGLKIDVWLPTVAEALQWGRRTVTITIR